MTRACAMMMVMLIENDIDLVNEHGCFFFCLLEEDDDHDKHNGAMANMFIINASTEC